MAPIQFQVRKRALSETRLAPQPTLPLAEGQVLARVDRCAYTTNNITYAAFGDAMQYWAFFPTDDPDWGCIPVWGFADVLESRHAEVAVGERLYGYWPMASHAVLSPARVKAAGFVDGAPHRAGLHAVYNQYTRYRADPYHAAGSEDLQALLRPLFTTAWLIDDFLADQDFFGAVDPAGPAARVLLSSASSKTAWSAASLLRRREGIELIGLTSPRNRAFCASLGLYHRVLAYDELEQLEPAAPALYVDFAGHAGLRQRVHRHLPQLVYSGSVGGTHVDDLGNAKDLPGPRAVLFFAPAQAHKRAADWGGAALEQGLVQAWQVLVGQAVAHDPPWLRVVPHAVPTGLAALHARMLQGQEDPRDGHVLVWQRRAADATDDSAR